jgi:hypothetical protein
LGSYRKHDFRRHFGFVFSGLPGDRIWVRIVNCVFDLETAGEIRPKEHAPAIWVRFFKAAR